MRSVWRLVLKISVLCVVIGGLFQVLPVHDRQMPQPAVSQKLRAHREPVQQPVVSQEMHKRVESVWVRSMGMFFENPAVLVAFPSLTTGEIIVETEHPASVPRAIEGVPVKVVQPKVLPPPPGVILLHLDGEIERREDLRACPSGFSEYSRYRWRFCQLPDDAQPIPMDLFTLPIGSMPFTEARKISARHYDRLVKLPRVTSVSLQTEGLLVRTSQPELVPPAIEWLPVKTAPADEPGYSTSTEPSPPELTLAHEPKDQRVKPPPTPALPSWQERQAVLNVHRAAWLQLPGVLDVVNGPEAIVAITDHPELFPTEIDGIAVRTVPVDEPVAGVPYLKAKQILERHRETLKSLPGAMEVGMHRGGIIVYTDNLAVVPSEVEGIPVVALSTKGPAVAGIPYLQVVAILERNRRRLMRIRGVQDVSYNHEGGIRINADYPELLPATVEGVPVKVDPCMGIVIAAVPCAEADKIYFRHKEAFLRLPGAHGVGLWPDGIIYVATEHPELLPPEVEGILVRPLPSEEERARQEQENARQQACAQAQLSPHEVSAERIQAVFACHHEALHNNPDVFGVMPNDQGFMIITDRPEGIPKEIDGIPVTIRASPRRLPAPPGIILLKPDGTRVNFPQATECPKGYTEDRQFRWRFCYDPTVPQRIPWEITMPPVAGVPHAIARAITERNRGWLKKVPGVTYLFLGEEGLIVHTQRPELLPLAIEGLSVITTPPQAIAVAL